MQIKRRRPKYKPQKDNKRTWVNEQIRLPRVYLIDENGQNVGVVGTQSALARAKAAGLDLVEVNPKARPPVCKIMDFGKYKYEQDKLAHKQKVVSKKSEIKGLRLSFKIKGGDLANRINQAKDFLNNGHQVKIEMILKGRERVHTSQAEEIIKNFVNDIDEQVKIMQPISKQGGRFSVVIAPINN